MVDFSLLISMLVALQNKIIISFNEIVSRTLPFKKIKMSSTNSKCVRQKCSMILSPCRPPLLFSVAISLLSPSITSRKRSGDKGHPCLIPLSILKEGKVDPLMRIAKETEEIQPMI